MEEFQINYYVLTATTLLFPIMMLWFFQKPSTGRKHPPSPSKLPIIGNLHQLTSLPHQDLYSLARKHGPIMLLHLGSVPVLIISSADLAKEITKTHDQIFASRPVFKAMKKLVYDGKSITLSPYGEYWRQMKSMLVLRLLSNKRVQSFRTIREEETALFVEKVRESSRRAVDLGAMFANFANDVIGRAAFGRKYSESEKGRKFLGAMADSMELFGVINIGDFIPWLDWIGGVNGFDKRLDKTAKDMDEVLESLVEERQRIQKEKDDGEDFSDILLQIYNDETVDHSIDRESLKALLLVLSLSLSLSYTLSIILYHIL